MTMDQLEVISDADGKTELRKDNRGHRMFFLANDSHAESKDEGWTPPVCRDPSTGSNVTTAPMGRRGTHEQHDTGTNGRVPRPVGVVRTIVD